MMTDKELQDFIENAVNKAICERIPTKEYTPRLLEPTHTKWFRGENGGAGDSKMGEAFDGDGVRTYQIWDRVRPICTSICGKAYVRQVSRDDADYINGVADRICQLIYESRLEFVEKHRQKERASDDRAHSRDRHITDNCVV